MQYGLDWTFCKSTWFRNVSCAVSSWNIPVLLSRLGSCTGVRQLRVHAVTSSSFSSSSCHPLLIMVIQIIMTIKVFKVMSGHFWFMRSPPPSAGPFAISILIMGIRVIKMIRMLKMIMVIEVKVFKVFKVTTMVCQAIAVHAVTCQACNSFH